MAAEANVHAVTAAIDRLLDGLPLVTDGKLTQGNLACEAGLSRTTLRRRFPEQLAEFDRLVAARAARGDGAAEATLGARREASRQDRRRGIQSPSIPVRARGRQAVH